MVNSLSEYIKGKHEVTYSNRGFSGILLVFTSFIGLFVVSYQFGLLLSNSITNTYDLTELQNTGLTYLFTLLYLYLLGRR